MDRREPRAYLRDMRLAALPLLWLAAAAPAAAQEPVCEESVSADIGEVIASVDARGVTTIIWAAERREGVGHESESFPRPGLLIDFAMSPDRTLGAAMRVEVLVSRISENNRPPPPISDMKVQAKPGGEPVVWGADAPRDGQKELAARLKKSWPDELVIDLVDKTGGLAASASFDLSKRPVVEKLAREARAKCPA